MGDSLTAQIGSPFSANRMYAPMKKGGMCKTRQYKAWIELNTPLIKKQLDPIDTFPVDIEIVILGGSEWSSRTRGGNKDVDNVLKPIIDLIVKAGILPDDSHKYVGHVRARLMPFLSGSTETCIHIHLPEEEESEWAPSGCMLDQNGNVVPIGGSVASQGPLDALL